MPTQVNAQEPGKEPTTVIGLDVYSADGQLVGRVSGYVAQAPEDETAFQEVSVDPVNSGGEILGSRRVLIDARGYPAQVEMAIPEEQLNVDPAARKVMLNLTMAQIQQMPHRDMNHQGDS